MTEELLTGGNIAPVVRIGDTVRRQTGPWSEAVHSLLLHLERRGYEASPRFLGIDKGPGGDRRFQEAVYDRDTDTALSPQVKTAAADAVLLFDGVFLLAPGTD